MVLAFFSFFLFLRDSLLFWLFFSFFFFCSFKGVIPCCSGFFFSFFLFL